MKILIDTRPLVLRGCAALLSLSVAFLGACGGSDDAAAPAGVSIGAAGGTVSSAGAQVVVPPGALAAPTTIGVEASSAGAPALPASPRPAPCSR